jgi:hypothetical protein
MPSPVAPVLVSRRVDSWLVGWLAVAVWVGALTVRWAHVSVGVDLTAQVYWIGAAVTAAHFGLSYHLAYGLGGESVRARRTALVVVPIVLAAVLVSVGVASLSAGVLTTRHVVTWSITSVYVLTTWHYVKQVYGIGRVAAAFSGVKLGKREVDVLRYGLYPLAWYGGVTVLVRGVNFSLAGYRVGIGVLPREVGSVLRVLAFCGAAAIAVVFVRIRRRGPLPSMMLAAYLASLLWLAVPVSALLTVLLLAPMHAIQYLAIGHRAEVAVARSRGEEVSTSWWLNIFVAATCAGLLLSRWIPNLLDRWIGTPNQPLLFAALFFVGLNLHHYLIDATIWRSSGELVRAVARRPGSAPAQPAIPVSASPAGTLAPAAQPA